VSYSLDSMKRGPDSLVVNQDSKVIAQRGFIYVLERLKADNLLKYDPNSHSVKYQKHISDNANPSDLIAVNDTLGYLSCEGVAQLYKLNLSTGKMTDSLDISPYLFTPEKDQGTKDVSPHATQLLMRGDTLFVALQRRNGDFKFAGGASMVLMVNTKTFKVQDTLVAPGKNESSIWLENGDLYMACKGAYGVNDDAIYRWNLSDRKVTEVLKESALGGDVGDLDCITADNCYVNITKTWPEVAIQRFNAKTGSVKEALGGLKSASGGFALDATTGNIYVGERDPKSSGILVFNSKNEKVFGPISSTLPPYNMVIAEF